MRNRLCLHSRWVLILLFVSLSVSSKHTMAQERSVQPQTAAAKIFTDNVSRYDHYRVYYVEIDTDEHVRVFQKLEEISDSCTFYGHARNPNQKLVIMVAAHKIADFADILQTFKVNHRVLTYNFQEQIDQQLKDVRPKDTDPSNLDWHHYFHLDTIYAWMEKLAKEHQELTLLDMGNSTQGVPIKGLKLSRKADNPTVFIESGIHAREWIAPATATYIINQLLTSTDARVKHFADSFNWIIFPVVNPDGYKFTFESDRMWRKNRKLFGISRGVDLNRNYPLHWNETGASSDPARYDYSGPSAGSEEETKRNMEFIKKNVKSERIRTYIALHSFSQLIMFPFGHTEEKVKNYDDLKFFGEQAAATIKRISGREYKSGSIYETIYPASGGSQEWANAECGIPITYTMELRGPPDSKDLFILPAKEITPTGEEAFAAILTIVDEASKRGYYQ